MKKKKPKSIGGPGVLDLDALTKGRPEYETVNHPAHYNQGDIEHCELVEDQGHASGYYFGQVTKYLFRAGVKPGTAHLEDLRKAAWYLNRWVAWRAEGKAIWKIQRKP